LVRWLDFWSRVNAKARAKREVITGSMKSSKILGGITASNEEAIVLLE
jgi:hypothetical protein